MSSPEDATATSEGARGASLLPTMKDQRPDAGTRHLNHYVNKLPDWRYALRQWLIPLVRWETPHLAKLQKDMRTPTLDSYFAFTANLGTHTFFMTALPVLFWCGYTSLGLAMVHMLAAGVFWSGFVKDMLCLPRPLSPPLQRISHSGSAALEYGFPSTHSTNAVSVVIYSIYALQSTAETRNPVVHIFAQALFYFYAVSIVFGRLYCGMHGFLDVVVGSALGGLIAVVQIMYGEAYDAWLCQSGYGNALLAALVLLILVRVHPEPADDCPCFDDSVAFIGVVIGVDIGLWHFAHTPYSTNKPIPGTVPFSLDTVGWPKTVTRIIFGVVAIFAWRGIMKPALFKLLPPIFRLIERIQLSMPRRFFLQASQYKSVPNLRKDDNVIPSASDIPRLFDTLRHPRKRSVSVGPQSAADAYETIAYRHKQRRESLSSDKGANATSPVITPVIEEASDVSMGATSAIPVDRQSKSNGSATPARLDGVDGKIPKLSISDEVAVDEEREAREIFLKLERPRVRYDVEVVTKLVVYCGIGWLVVEANPLLFVMLGMGA